MPEFALDIHSFMLGSLGVGQVTHAVRKCLFSRRGDGARAEGGEASRDPLMVIAGFPAEAQPAAVRWGPEVCPLAAPTTVPGAGPPSHRGEPAAPTTCLRTCLPTGSDRSSNLGSDRQLGVRQVSFWKLKIKLTQFETVNILQAQISWQDFQTLY